MSEPIHAMLVFRNSEEIPSFFIAKPRTLSVINSNEFDTQMMLTWYWGTMHTSGPRIEVSFRSESFC